MRVGKGGASRPSKRDGRAPQSPFRHRRAARECALLNGGVRPAAVMRRRPRPGADAQPAAGCGPRETGGPSRLGFRSCPPPVFADEGGRQCETVSQASQHPVASATPRRKPKSCSRPEVDCTTVPRCPAGGSTAVASWYRSWLGASVGPGTKEQSSSVVPSPASQGAGESAAASRYTEPGPAVRVVGHP